MKRTLTIHTPHGLLHGQVDLPEAPKGLILLARTQHTPVDAIITASFAARGYATLSIELLTMHEAQFADATQNVPRLSQRLLDILDLIAHDGDLQGLPLAIFACGDASPAAIRAAAQRDRQVMVVAGQNTGRAITLMDVTIDNQYPACQAFSLHGAGGHGGIIDRAGLQGLKLLVAPLCMLFDSSDQIGQAAYLRAASYLNCSHETNVLNPGEDPILRVVAWFSLHFRR